MGLERLSVWHFEPCYSITCYAFVVNPFLWLIHFVWIWAWKLRQDGRNFYFLCHSKLLHWHLHWGVAMTWYLIGIWSSCSGSTFLRWCQLICVFIYYRDSQCRVCAYWSHEARSRLQKFSNRKLFSLIIWRRLKMVLSRNLKEKTSITWMAACNRTNLFVYFPLETFTFFINDSSSSSKWELNISIQEQSIICAV